MQNSCRFPFDAGTVTVENMGLGGVTVRLSGMADGETTTDDSGQYSFTGLRAGTYSVEISSFDTNEVSFSSTSGAATVGVGESKVVSFDGTYLRTAGIQGQVTVDGAGLEGVTVTLNGEGEDRTEVTNAAGQYAFSKLKSGTYQIGITNPDPDDYEFAVTSKSQTIATGEVANVPFEGTLLRTAGIAGRVSLDDGMGLPNVTVTLAGAEERTATTDDGGQYSFAGLAAGTYVLSIANPNETAYNFAEDEMQKTVVLADDEAKIVNFSGTHTRTASISGTLFIDEVDQNMEHDPGEPSIVTALAPLLPTLDEATQMMVAGLLTKAKVKLLGPDLSDPPQYIDIQADGSFTTGEALMAGSYQLELPVNDEAVAAALEAAGVAFVGGSEVVAVEAGGSQKVNFPFRITMQTVVTGACMGLDGCAVNEATGTPTPVAGVKLALYARADMAGEPLGEGTTNEMGMAAFHFERSANTGPAGNDNIVFVKVMDSGALEVSGNNFVEVAYAPTARLYAADAGKEYATLVNTAVAFDFWVKSNEDARNGDMGLGDWRVQYCMPMDKTDDAEAVVCEGDKAAFMDIMVGEGDDAEPAMTDTTTATRGKASFATTVDKAMLPAEVYVRVTPVAVDEDGKRTDVQPDAEGTGEMWEATGPLMLEHSGLDLPPGKDDDPTDVGPIRITWTSQALVVGAHRELDDQPGYSQYRSDYPHDDADTDTRPSNGLLTVELMYSENGGRLKRYEYKKFDAKGERKTEVANPMAVTSGTATFPNLPTDMDFTVRIRPGANRVAVSERDVDAYGLDDSDNRIVGTFGTGAGARPDVWVCPETDVTPMDDDFKARCSAFGYQWATGTQKVSVTNLRKDVVATVALVPVTDNHSQGDSKDLKGSLTSAGAIADKSHTFSGIQDGVYAVAISGSAIGKKDPVRRVFYHDEGSDDEEYDGEAGADISFSATSLRAEIRGLVANNRINSSSNTLSGDEAGEGVTLTLHKTAKNADDETVIGAAVKDDNDDPVTATTNGDGEYAFEGLEEGKDYFVKVTDCPGCEAYHSIDAETHAFVPYGMTAAKVYAPTASNTAPTWDHEAGTVAGIISNVSDGGFLDFALLYTDGELSGSVTEPFDDVDRHRIELSRCLTYQPEVEADPTATPPVVAAAEACKIEDESYAGADPRTDDDGEWTISGLREGMYMVTTNPRGSFAVFVADTDPDTDGNQQGSKGEETEYVPLDAGSGSAAETASVPIVNTSKSTGTALASAIIHLGDDQLAFTDGGSAVSQTVDYVVGTVGVAPVAATTNTDARFEVAIGTEKKTVGKDGIATLDLKGTGTANVNTITITVVAANGYAKSAAQDAAEITRTAAQTDASVASVEATYRDRATNGTVSDATTSGSSFSNGAYRVNIPATAVDGSNFKLTITLDASTSPSDWAVVEYRVGSGAYQEIAISDNATDAAGRAARVTGNIALPAEGADVELTVRVKSQDGKTTNPYRVVVNQASSG